MKLSTLEKAKRTSVKQLLRTPQPLPDESLIGYILRLSSANHCKSIKWILDLINVRLDLYGDGWRQLCNPSIDFSILKLCTGLTDDQIREMQYEVFSEYEYFRSNYHGDWNIPNYAISFSSPKICIRCLREAPYCRKIWDLIPLTICPWHKVMLINTCPACKKRIIWERKSITECYCGYDWRETQLRRVRESDHKILQYLMSAPSLIIGNKFESLTVDNRFMNLSFGDRCRALLTLADILSYCEDGKCSLLSSYYQNNRSHKILMQTISLLNNWPYEIYRYLDQNPPQYNTKYLSQGFDRLEGYSKLEFLRVTMDEYLHCSSLTSYSPSFTRYVEPNHTYDILKRADINLNILLTSDRVRIVNGLMNPMKILVDRTSLEYLVEHRKRMLEVDISSFILGVNDDQLVDMIHHYCLQASSGPHIDGFPNFRIKRDAIFGLYSQIEKLAQNGENSIWSSGFYEGMMPFNVLVELSSSKLSFGKLIRAILNGEIKPFKLPYNTDIEFGLLRHFVYRKDEVEHYLAKIAEPKNK